MSTSAAQCKDGSRDRNLKVSIEIRGLSPLADARRWLKPKQDPKSLRRSSLQTQIIAEHLPCQSHIAHRLVGLTSSKNPTRRKYHCGLHVGQNGQVARRQAVTEHGCQDLLNFFMFVTALVRAMLIIIFQLVFCIILCLIPRRAFRLVI